MIQSRESQWKRMAIYHYTAKCNWPNNFELMFNRWENKAAHGSIVSHVSFFPLMENTDPNILGHISL